MVDVVPLGARQRWSRLCGVTRDVLVRLRCSISLPGGEGQARRRGAGQEDRTPHRWGWQGHRQLGPAPPPPATDSTARATRGWFSSLLWYNHGYYKQRKKNNFKNHNKLIKGRYWKAKTESGTVFRQIPAIPLCSLHFFSFSGPEALHVKQSKCLWPWDNDCTDIWCFHLCFLCVSEQDLCGIVA